MARISVIIPCYNYSAFLPQAIASILGQDVQDWELILADDGSTDSTPEIIRGYCSCDARIRSVRQDNGGRSAARNLGALQSSADAQYLFFLDSDDQLVPNALRLMSGYLDSHPEVGLLGCQFQETDEQGRPFGSAKRSRWVPGWFLPRALADEERETPFVTFFCATGQGPFAMYRKSVFQRTQSWDNDFRHLIHEDTDMFCQMALLADVHYIPDRLYLKRVHEAAATQHCDFVQDSYAKFRHKWDNYQTDDPRQQEIIRKAKKHYYTRHRPFRDLKVAVKTLKYFLRDPTKARMVWFLTLCKSAMKGLFLER